MRNFHGRLLGALVVGLWLAACNRGDDSGLQVRKAARKTPTPAQSAQQSISTPPMALAHTTDTTAVAPPGASASPSAANPNADASASPQTSASPASAPSGVSVAAPTSAATDATTSGAPPTTTEPVPTQLAKSFTNISVLLDASGSMTGPIENGTKIGFASTMIKDLLTQPAPTGMTRAFGVRVFGARTDAAQNDCEDITLLAGLGAVDPARIGANLSTVQAKGQSPIAYALQQAAQEMPEANNDRDNVILLIADGGDTCNADPCAAAEQLHAGPKRVIIHVIGFDLDQTGEQQLRCIASKSDGRFFLARNVAELRSSADEALNANLPYNLRIKSYAGSAPLPTQITVKRAGTEQIVADGHSTGVKFFQLPPGTYDVQVTFADSVESAKPSKILKGVEVQASSRAEQIVYFDLATLQLSGKAPDGSPANLTYAITDPKTGAAIATTPPSNDPALLTLAPGTYNITASGPMVSGIPLSSTHTNVSLRAGEKGAQEFSFTTGRLFLRAQTSQGTFIPADFSLYNPLPPQNVLMEGAIPPEGRELIVPSGAYGVQLRPSAGLFQTDKAMEFSSLEVAPNDLSQQLVTVPVGTITLLGKDGGGTPVQTEFAIQRVGGGDVIAREVSTTTPASLTLAPGHYIITATRVGMAISPPPTMTFDDVEISAERPESKEALFFLGTLDITGRNAKDNPLPTEVTIFKPGNADTPVATQRSLSGVVSFTLTPGLYDIRAQDVSTSGTLQPTIWLRGVAVAANNATQQMIKFTAGRVRLTCRGTNDTPILCTFRVFTYGQDAPLYAGDTTDQWQEFEMQPGYYYLEAGHFDEKDDQTLKKWINITVSENQTVEQIIRY